MSVWNRVILLSKYDDAAQLIQLGQILQKGARSHSWQVTNAAKYGPAWSLPTPANLTTRSTIAASPTWSSPAKICSRNNRGCPPFGRGSTTRCPVGADRGKMLQKRPYPRSTCGAGWPIVASPSAPPPRAGHVALHHIISTPRHFISQTGLSLPMGEGI